MNATLPLNEKNPIHYSDYPINVDYLSIAKSIDRRKTRIKDNIATSAYHFSDGVEENNYLIDAFHGEMHFGSDPSSIQALNNAWKNIVLEEQEHFIQHNKKQPKALQELTTEFLFERLVSPETEVLDGVSLGVEDTVIVPYSSTQLIISALKARPRKDLHDVLCPEGFYKGAAKLAAAAGLTIRTLPVDLDNDGVIIPELLDSYLSRYHSETALLWLTMPGNPLIASHSLEQLEAIAKIVINYDMDVLIDMAFDKILPKGKYLPLPNIRVQDENGQWQLMHDRAFSITGNSKGLGATGPWKLGAGVCGNKKWRQDTLDLVTAITFQRESTHLIHAGTSTVSQAYLENNQETLKNVQQNVKKLIKQTNNELGDEILLSYGAPVYTPFHCIRINDKYLDKAGIRDSWQFANFLLAGAGIDSVELIMFGINKPGARLNVASPRIDGNKTPDNIYPLFNRLKVLLRDMQQGLSYGDALKRIDVTEKVQQHL